MIVINWNIPFYEGHIFKPDNKESVLSIVLEFHLIYRWSFEGMLVNPSTSCKCVLRQISLTRDFFLQILTHTCKHLGEVRFKSTLWGHCPDRYVWGQVSNETNKTILSAARLSLDMKSKWKH